MTAIIIKKEVILEHLARVFRVEGSDQVHIFRRVVARAVKRAVFILSPCAQSRLQSAVVSSLLGVGPSDEDVEKIVADVIEQLIAFGDILEMRNSDNDPWRESPYVLRPAPPAFVMKPDGSAFILGVAGDELSPLNSDLELRLYHNGVLQILDPIPGEDLCTTLRDLGLIELKESVWLRLPRVQDPISYLKMWRDELALQVTVNSIEGLSVIDPNRSNHFYKGRWSTEFRSLNGVFVARRPQAYGAPIWCLVELQEGRSRRFLDFISKGDRVRPCDIAWRVQLALDAVAGTSQQFSLSRDEEDTVFSFFGPLPSWAERKLATASEQLGENRGALFALKFKAGEVAEHVRFLREHVWLEERPLNRGGGT